MTFPQETSKGLLSVSCGAAGARLRRLFGWVHGSMQTLGCALVLVRNPQDRTWWDVVTVGAIWICASIALYVAGHIEPAPAEIAQWLLEVFAALFVISGVARIAQGSILRPDDAQFLEGPEIRRSHQSRAEIDHLLVRRVAALAIDASRLCREGASIAVLGLLLQVLSLTIQHAVPQQVAPVDGNTRAAAVNGVAAFNAVATFKMEQTLTPASPTPELPAPELPAASDAVPNDPSADAPLSSPRLNALPSAENYQNARDLPL